LQAEASACKTNTT